MNSCDSAALLAQASGTVDNGFLALAIVQGLGVVLAIGMTICIRKAYTIPDRWHACMLTVVVAVFGATIFVAACQEDLAPDLWVAFGGTLDEFQKGPSFLYWFDLHTAHLIYFLADFGALAFLIYATGGPQQSLYATFLFVIVPISIALGLPNLGTVVVFAGITLAIFLTLLPLKPPKYFSAIETGNLARKGWLAGVTTACVFFPTLVFCIQNWGPGDTAAGATPQQTRVKTMLASPVDLEHIAMAGNHDAIEKQR